MYTWLQPLHTAHKICNAGEWTEATGDATADTKCTACSTGRYRSQAPTDTKIEVEEEVCVLQKICAAGEWTKATGSSATDTTCVPCKAGTFREKAPTDIVAEQKRQACTLNHRLTWERSRNDVQCNTRAGEVLLESSSRKVQTFDKCRESCERALGCQSVTFFQNGWCGHFSTPCTNTKTNKKSVVAVQVLATALHSKSNAAMVEHTIEQNADDSCAHAMHEICFILSLYGIFMV